MPVTPEGTAVFIHSWMKPAGKPRSLCSKTRKRYINQKLSFKLNDRMTDILQKIAKILEQRKGQDPETSYVAGLYQKGLDEILKKVGEEASEVIIAAKGDDSEAIIHETADLWFHTLVLLSHKGLTPDEVEQELQRRFGRSGLKEKAERGQ